ncbi:CopG family transcriptional regulator [Nocardiopsis sp. CNT-189]|uniref:CopG family transcriptional regulator n=1 Tax=Nocardiopsis oceanisediminis TaxID=2816862 RepID=UPI003B2C0F72
MATKKITVTVPEELLEEIRDDATERGISAYVTEAIRQKREHDLFVELSDWLQEEHGPVTDEELAAGRAELEELAAEHERRRGQRSGEAA